MDKAYTCSECDYCYSNETMGQTYICVNYRSDLFGKPVDWLGLANEDMECAVINGIESGELREENAEENAYESE